MGLILAGQTQTDLNQEIERLKTYSKGFVIYELDDYLPGPLSAFQIQGKTYGLPFIPNDVKLVIQVEAVKQ